MGHGSIQASHSHPPPSTAAIPRVWYTVQDNWGDQGAGDPGQQGPKTPAQWNLNSGGQFQSFFGGFNAQMRAAWCCTCGISNGVMSRWWFVWRADSFLRGCFCKGKKEGNMSVMGGGTRQIRSQSQSERLDGWQRGISMVWDFWCRGRWAAGDRTIRWHLGRSQQTSSKYYYSVLLVHPST